MLSHSANTVCCLLMFIYTHFTKHAFLEGCGNMAAMVTMEGALHSDMSNSVPQFGAASSLDDT